MIGLKRFETAPVAAIRSRAVGCARRFFVPMDAEFGVPCTFDDGRRQALEDAARTEDLVLGLGAAEQFVQQFGAYSVGQND